MENLRSNYKGECREAFEDMVTHMFMRRLKLFSAPVRRKNQKGVESDPVDVNRDIDEECREGRYAYQAKYLDPGTGIASIKDQLLNCIETAKERKVTDLFFYVNKRITENSKAKWSGEPDANIPDYQKVIDETARNAAVRIHWYPCDVIEAELCKPEYGYIRRMFLEDENKFDTYGYYEHICDLVCKIDENYKAVYGNISLLESYIEPVIRDRNGTGKKAMVGYNQSVREYLENWVMGSDSVAIICGEPGHGKTSLGWKAVYDFFKDGWLENKVENVFCFSLNPAGLREEDKKGIFDYKDIWPFLSWKSSKMRRHEKTQRAEKDDCKNSLIFLDGFDELKESVPGHTMEELLDAVWRFLKEYEESCFRPHIIITTRRMAIPLDSEREEYYFPDDEEGVIPIKELQPVEEKRQYEWISNYIEHLRDLKGKNPAFLDKYIEEYKKMYSILEPDDELRAILGVPIIFRMFVVQGYIPNRGDHPAAIYDDLFKETLARHNVATGEGGIGLVKRKLSRHALRVYADNGNSAEVRDDPEMKSSPWTYAFYTRYGSVSEENCPARNTLRVGFLHETVFEYFLAAGILSWLKCCDKNGILYIGEKKIVPLADLFSILGKQRLTDGVLRSIQTLYKREQGKRKKIRDEAFEAVYKILRETDGILNFPQYGSIEPNKNEPEDRFDIRELFDDIYPLMQKDASTPFHRAETVFWNVLSICSLCEHPVEMDGSANHENRYFVRGSGLRTYNLKGVHLEKAVLKSTDLRGARLEESHLEETDLYGADLEGADLKRANLPKSRLEGAVLRNAVLEGAVLINASMEGADLKGAFLNGADLSEANLEGAYLDGVMYDEKEKVCRGVSVGAFEMKGTKFKDARLDGAFISEEQARTVKKAGGLGLPDEIPEVIRISGERTLIQIVRGNRSKVINLSGFGCYSREEDGKEVPLSWKLLRMERDRALIITEVPIQQRSYHNSLEAITWEHCDLRKWLNGEFLKDSFTDTERGMIARVCNQNPDNERYGAEGGNPTWDHIFALSMDEAKLYFRSDEDRRALGWWWLRSPGFYSMGAAFVRNGGVYEDGSHVDSRTVSVRPALWIKL